MANGDLTPKQEKFCHAYLATGSASEAYRQSYKTDKMNPASVNREAKALTDDPKITTRIETLQARTLKKYDVTADRIIAEYARIAFSNLEDYGPWSKSGIVLKDSSEPWNPASRKPVVPIQKGGDLR